MLTIKYISMQPKIKIEETKEKLNLTEDEQEIFDMLMSDKSIVQISDKMGFSIRTCSRRIANIKHKIKQL